MADENDSVARAAAQEHKDHEFRVAELDDLAQILKLTDEVKDSLARTIAAEKKADDEQRDIFAKHDAASLKAQRGEELTAEEEQHYWEGRSKHLGPEYLVRCFENLQRQGDVQKKLYALLKSAQYADEISPESHGFPSHFNNAGRIDRFLQAINRVQRLQTEFEESERKNLESLKLALRSLRHPDIFDHEVETILYAAIHKVDHLMGLVTH